MKNMPGMSGIQEMLSKMGMSAAGAGLGKGSKINYGAMEAELNKKMKIAKMKERMYAKSETNKAMKEANEKAQENTAGAKPAISEEELIALFSKCEKPEKTPRKANVDNSLTEENTKPKNKKKKGKK
jgi:hypothetical protein